MSKYGLIIIITKYTTYVEIIKETFICNSLDECKDQLINYLVNIFKDINIDFPIELQDFEYIWFNQNYIKSDVFLYDIYSIDINQESTNWIQPWESQDIYTDVLDKIYEIDINNSLNNDNLDNLSDNN